MYHFKRHCMLEMFSGTSYGIQITETDSVKILLVKRWRHIFAPLYQLMSCRLGTDMYRIAYKLHLQRLQSGCWCCCCECCLLLSQNPDDSTVLI